ncbi:unnamed protein product [Amoebophrya sp. A25]|nr:unnamed protein product [Amoebophrya sp. A25]|eukprot:GSA25T00006339001.1
MIQQTTAETELQLPNVATTAGAPTSSSKEKKPKEPQKRQQQGSCPPSPSLARMMRRLPNEILVRHLKARRLPDTEMQVERVKHSKSRNGS